MGVLAEQVGAIIRFMERSDGVYTLQDLAKSVRSPSAKMWTRAQLTRAMRILVRRGTVTVETIKIRDRPVRAYRWSHPQPIERSAHPPACPMNGSRLPPSYCDYDLVTRSCGYSCARDALGTQQLWRHR